MVGYDTHSIVRSEKGEPAFLLLAGDMDRAGWRSMVESACVCVCCSVVCNYLGGLSVQVFSEGFRGVLLQGSGLAKARNNNKNNNKAYRNKLVERMQRQAELIGVYNDKLVTKNAQ